MNVQPHHGAFAAFPKQNDKCPTNARRGGGWACLELTEPLRIKMFGFLSMSIFKPHCGGFVWTFSPTMGHLQLFQNEMTNVRQRPEGGGGWACLELTEPLRIKMFGFLSMSWRRRLFFFHKATKDWTCLLWHMVYMLQLKINFRLKFFNLCLFSISFVSWPLIFVT